MNVKSLHFLFKYISFENKTFGTPCQSSLLHLRSALQYCMTNSFNPHLNNLEAVAQEGIISTASYQIHLLLYL